MAKSLKTQGMEEIGLLKRRVLRQHSLGRISAQDRDELATMIGRIEAKIVRMDEKQEQEGGSLW